MGKRVCGRISGALVLTAALALSGSSAPAAAAAVDCAAAKIHCVGAAQEFDNIQSAVDRAKRGHEVVVFAGEYQGFRVSRSGSKNKRTIIRGVAGARIVAAEAESDDGIYLRRVSYVTIDGFEVDGGGSMHFGIGTHDATATKPVVGVEIVNNTVHDARSTNIYVSNAADSLVEGNVAHGSRESHGFYLANAGSDNVILRFNRAYGNAVNGMHFNGDDSVGGDGLHQGLLVEGNVLYDNVANGFDADGVQDSTFRNNVVYGNGRHGLRAFAIDASAGPANLIIVNNTFEGNGGWAVKLTEDSGGHTLFNNILLSDAGSVVVGHPDVRSDYNVVGKGFSLDGEETVMSLSQWRRGGNDRNSRKGKARKLFEDFRSGDYHLTKTAIAVDAGIKSLAGEAAPRRDIDLGKRPQGNGYDVGAYERSAS